MHYLHSGKAWLAFRFGALGMLLFAINLLVPTVLGPLGLLTHDSNLLRWTLYFMAGLPVTGLIYLLWGSRARCPLCLNPPLVTRSCAKHRTAGTLAGSYRLRVATAIFLTGRFTCPYCGERTCCQVRDRNRRFPQPQFDLD